MLKAKFPRHLPGFYLDIIYLGRNADACLLYLVKKRTWL